MGQPPCVSHTRAMQGDRDSKAVAAPASSATPQSVAPDSGSDSANEDLPLQSTSVRRWITLSYWVVLLACVPYWWYSTTIERHPLPLDEIASWTAQEPCPVRLPLRVHLTGARLTRLEENALKSAAQARCLDFERPAVKTKTTLNFIVDSDSQGPPAYSSPTLAYLSGPSVTDDVLAALAIPQAQGPTSATFSRHGQESVKFASKYKLVFSLLNEDLAKGGALDWDVVSALEGGFALAEDHTAQFLLSVHVLL